MCVATNVYPNGIESLEKTAISQSGMVVNASNHIFGGQGKRTWKFSLTCITRPCLKAQSKEKRKEKRNRGKRREEERREGKGKKKNRHPFPFPEGDPELVV